MAIVITLGSDNRLVFEKPNGETITMKTPITENNKYDVLQNESLYNLMSRETQIAIGRIMYWPTYDEVEASNEQEAYDMMYGGVEEQNREYLELIAEHEERTRENLKDEFGNDSEELRIFNETGQMPNYKTSKNNEKITCNLCGCNVSRNGLERHQSTRKCGLIQGQRFMKNLEIKMY